jgi:hypothetical protein
VSMGEPSGAVTDGIPRGREEWCNVQRWPAWRALPSNRFKLELRLKRSSGRQ